MGGRIFPQLTRRRRFPQDALMRSHPQPWVRPSRAGTKMAVVEIELDSGRQLLSFSELSTARGLYLAEVLDIGSIVRELSLLTGGMRESDCTITLKNPNRKWNTILSQEVIKERAVRIKLANESDGIQQALPLFTGVIEHHEISRSQIQMELRGTMFDIFHQPLSSSFKVFNTTDFPNMPTDARYMGELVPFVMGNWDDFSHGSGNLPLPAYLIDTTTWTYVLGQLPSPFFFWGDTITNGRVRRYGGNWLGTTPVVGAATYGGMNMATLDFSQDQRDLARPDELEITWKMHTLSDYDHPSLTSGMTNPVKQLHNFLRAWVPGCSDTDFDIQGREPSPSPSGSYVNNPTARSVGNSSIMEAMTAAEAPATDEKGLVHIGGDPTQTFTDIIRKFSESLAIGVYITRGGLFGIYHWVNSNTSGLALDSALSESHRGYVRFTEDDEIVRDSYIGGVPDDLPPADIIVHEAGFHVVDDIYTYNAVTSGANPEYLKGKRPKYPHSAAYIDVASTVGEQGNTLLRLVSPLNRQHAFRVPAEWFYDLELNRLIEIVHRDVIHGHQSLTKQSAAQIFLRFGEKMGTAAADKSGNGLNGVYNGGYTLGVPGAIIGDTDTAVRLDGATGFVSVADHPILDPGDTLSIRCWCKFSLFDGNTHTIIDKGSTQYKVWEVSGSLFFGQHNSGAMANADNRINLHQWHHLMFTKAGPNTAKIYVDSRNVTQAVTDFTLSANAIALNIGRDTGNTEYSPIEIDEFALWNRDLNTTEIRADYLAGLARYSPSTVARIIGLELNPRASDMDILVRALELKLSL